MHSKLRNAFARAQKMASTPITFSTAPPREKRSTIAVRGVRIPRGLAASAKVDCDHVVVGREVWGK
ncbi:MAG: hypothetical protein ACXWC5_32135, partial [Burkholderiales bacterium]